MTLQTAVADTLAAFNAAGIPATTDPRNLNPPGALIALPTVLPRFGRPCADAQWRAYLVVPNAGQPGTVENLSDLLGTLLNGNTGIPFTVCRPFDLALPGGGEPVPAYEIEWQSTHSI